MNQPFIPAWAADTLSKPTSTELAELALLREFFDLWVEFHTLPKGQMSTKKGKDLGHELMEKVAVLQRFKNPQTVVVTQKVTQ